MVAIDRGPMDCQIDSEMDVCGAATGGWAASTEAVPRAVGSDAVAGVGSADIVRTQTPPGSGSVVALSLPKLRRGQQGLRPGPAARTAPGRWASAVAACVQRPRAEAPPALTGSRVTRSEATRSEATRSETTRSETAVVCQRLPSLAGVRGQPTFGPRVKLVSSRRSVSPPAARQMADHPSRVWKGRWLGPRRSVPRRTVHPLTRLAGRTRRRSRQTRSSRCCTRSGHTIGKTSTEPRLVLCRSDHRVHSSCPPSSPANGDQAEGPLFAPSTGAYPLSSGPSSAAVSFVAPMMISTSDSLNEG